MANIKISELNELTKSQTAYDDYLAIVDTSADETKKISVENLIASNVELLAVVEQGEPEPEPIQGARYYSKGANLIFYAYDDEHWGRPQTPIAGIFYVVISEQTTYTYDEENETLVSVGGGSGGGETLPIGTVLEFPTTDSTKVPDGWLFCDGSAVSRTTYADLFAIIGTSFGAGDGSTTFNLPTKEGLVSVGIKSSDTDFDTIGETGGSKELQQHNHTLQDDNGNNFLGLISSAYTGNNGWNVTNASSTTNGGSLLGRTTKNAGTGNSGNLQPYTVTNYIIKATETTPVQAEVVNDYSTSQENAYSCDYSNKAFGGTLLWTNSSPTASFSNQTVALDLSNYDEIEIIYYTDVEAASWKYQKTTGRIKIKQGDYILLGGYLMITTADQAPQFFGRTAQINSTGSGTQGIIFGSGKNYSSSSFSTRNASGVPIYIIGYKTGLFN